MIEFDGVEDARVALRAGGNCTGFDSADATSKVGVLATGFVRGSGTAAAVTTGFSGLASIASTVAAFGACSFSLVRNAPNSVDIGCMGLGSPATCVVRSERPVGSGPLAMTRAICASGTRGQCRTLPVSIWTKLEEG